MVDVAKFLASLGLAQYVERFAAHDIDAAALAHLEESHLKELGLTLGHRVRLLNALAELRASGAPASAAPRVEESEPQAQDGERRQLTVMFCDLVGSSELSQRLDPEEMQRVIHAYHLACASTIARFEGHVAQYLGDGVLAYFGYPLAQEHAAERAVRAALATVKAVAALPAAEGRRLKARIGIATGLVVVGKAFATDRAGSLSATGETPNLAARLQSVAEPGCAVIAQSTHALTRGSFHYRALGELSLKGFKSPVAAWQVLGEAGATRFEAAHTGRLTTFVGREQEVALLGSRWEQAECGEGQVVLLCGEPGIGKSRIAEQFRLMLRDVEHTRIRWQCSPFHTSSALQPVIGQLEFAAGFTPDDDHRSRLEKLERLLQATSPQWVETLPLFASLLGVDLAGRYAMPALTADAIRKRTLDALADSLLALARAKPVYWQVEDAHWIDPTTRELVGLCLARIRDARVFALITFRPELAAPWTGLPHVTTLTLNRLARRQSVALIEQVAEGQLPTPVLDQILAKTEGIPLFIEELTKAVLEAGVVVQAEGRYVLGGQFADVAIPTTLQDSLMARLDRLAPVKEVAQIGAAIGREFTYDLIAALAPMSSAELDDALAKLVAAELVYVRGQPPESSYVFKHALVQDAAYASLLRTRRHQLHSRIADTLQQKSPDAVARRPELIAHHYEAAGLDQPAKKHWTLAGQRAVERSDYAEAGVHFDRALALARKAPESEGRRREEADLVIGKAITVHVLRGPGSVESGRIADEAVAISAPLGDDPLHFRARWAEWIYNSLAGNLPVASERADRLVDMARRLGHDDLRLQAHHARWTTAFLRGRVAVTREDIEQGLALYDRDKHRDHWMIYGAHDPGVCARGTGGCTLWQAGFPERAAAVAADAVEVAETLGHPFSRAVALWYSGFFAMMVSDAPAARRHAEKLSAVASEAKMVQPAGMAKFIDGWAIARLSDLGRGTAQMESAYRAFSAAKQRGYLTFLGTYLATAKLEMQRVDEALGLLDELDELCAQTYQQLFRSEIHRLRGQAFRALNAADPRVEAQYRAALAIAVEQGARALELRAANDLAQWLADSGRAEDGLRILRPIYDSFSEGRATPDLASADRTLTALR